MEGGRRGRIAKVESIGLPIIPATQLIVISATRCEAAPPAMW